MLQYAACPCYWHDKCDVWKCWHRPESKVSPEGCLTPRLMLIELMSVGSCGSWFMVCHRCLLPSRWEWLQWGYLLAVCDVAWHEQYLGGREGGGDGQTVLLIVDLLYMGVDPLLYGKEHKLFWCWCKRIMKLKSDSNSLSRELKRLYCMSLL